MIAHKRVQMLNYYQGFGAGNTYELGLYPRTAATYRTKIRRATFLDYAEYNAGLLPPLPPKPRRLRSLRGLGVDGPKTRHIGKFSAHQPSR